MQIGFRRQINRRRSPRSNTNLRSAAATFVLSTTVGGGGRLLRRRVVYRRRCSYLSAAKLGAGVIRLETRAKQVAHQLQPVVTHCFVGAGVPLFLLLRPPCACFVTSIGGGACRCVTVRRSRWSVYKTRHVNAAKEFNLLLCIIVQHCFRLEQSAKVFL